MPERMRRPCAAPGCGALVESGYCSLHAKRSDPRPNSNSRGYDSEWRRFREWFLSKPEHAVCEDCSRAPSTDVHHVKKVRDYPHLRFIESNCRGLCHKCHSVRTSRGE